MQKYAYYECTHYAISSENNLVATNVKQKIVTSCC